MAKMTKFLIRGLRICSVNYSYTRSVLRKKTKVFSRNRPEIDIELKSLISSGACCLNITMIFRIKVN